MPAAGRSPEEDRARAQRARAEAARARREYDRAVARWVQPSGQKRDRALARLSELPDLLPVAQVADELGVCETTVRRLATDGYLEAVKVSPRRLKITNRSVVAHIERGGVLLLAVLVALSLLLARGCSGARAHHLHHGREHERHAVADRKRPIATHEGLVQTVGELF